MLVIFFVLYQNLKVQLIFVLLLSQSHRLFIVVQVLAHLYCCLYVK